MGSRAFVIPEAPVRTSGRTESGGRALARSITHPDFEPLWDAAEDLGMAASAVELCERQLASANVSDEVRTAFFGGVGELLGV